MTVKMTKIKNLFNYQSHAGMRVIKYINYQFNLPIRRIVKYPGGVTRAELLLHVLRFRDLAGHGLEVGTQEEGLA